MPIPIQTDEITPAQRRLQRIVRRLREERQTASATASQGDLHSQAQAILSRPNAMRNGMLNSSVVSGDEARLIAESGILTENQPQRPPGLSLSEALRSATHALLQPQVTPEQVQRLPGPLRPLGMVARELTSPAQLGLMVATAGVGPTLAGALRGGAGAVGQAARLAAARVTSIAGVGPPLAAALRGGAGAVGLAGRGAAGLITPVARGPFASRLAAEVGVQGAGIAGAMGASRLTQNAPTPIRIAAPFVGGLVGGAGALGAARALGPAAEAALRSTARVAGAAGAIVPPNVEAALRAIPAERRAGQIRMIETSPTLSAEQKAARISILREGETPAARAALEAVAAKEPWQMTKAEFAPISEFPTGGRFSLGGEAAKLRVIRNQAVTKAPRGMNEYFTTEAAASRWARREHKQLVRQALFEGKPVPAEVLADYPDLAARATQPIAPVAERGVLARAPVEGNRLWETGAERPFAFDLNSTKNQGRFRLLPPKPQGEYITRQSGTPGVSYIVDTEDNTIQAVRFNKAQFPEAKAAQWWDANKGRFKFSEAAGAPPLEPPAEAAGAGRAPRVMSDTEAFLFDVRHLAERIQNETEKARVLREYPIGSSVRYIDPHTREVQSSPYRGIVGETREGDTLYGIGDSIKATQDDFLDYYAQPIEEQIRILKRGAQMPSPQGMVEIPGMRARMEEQIQKLNTIEAGVEGAPLLEPPAGRLPPPKGPRPTPGMSSEGVPPQAVGNLYVAPLRALEDVAKEVVIRDDLLAQVAARTGINPSVLRGKELGRILTAYERQQVAIDNLVDVAVASALDRHAQAVTGRLGQVLPLDVQGFIKSTGKLWHDVFTTPDAYALAAKGTRLRAYIDDFNQLIVEAERLRIQGGLAPLSRILPEGTFYIPRQVKGVRGVELRRPSSPKLQRYYEEATEGFGRGVRYDTSPRATAELHLRVAYREVLEEQLSNQVADMGLRPSLLVPAAIRERAATAARAYAQAKLALQKTVVPQRLRAALGTEAAQRLRKLGAIRKEMKASKPALRAALATAQSEFFAARAQYSRALAAARRAEIAPGNLFGQAPETISISQWRGRFFPREQADMLNDATGFLAKRNEQSPFVKGLGTLGNTIRYLASVADLAEPFIQGLPMLTRDPILWSKAALRHYQAFFDPTVQSRYLRNNLKVVQEMARYGVPIGDVEFFAALKPGQGISFQKLFNIMPKGAETQRLMRMGGRQTFGRFQSAYNMGLTAKRVYLWDTLKKGIPDQAERAAYIRNVTGGLESKALGVGPTQRAVEGMWLGFSPKLLRSTASLVADAVRPTTPRGRESLRTLAQLAAGATGLYVLTGLALGKSWEEIQTGLNPLNGKKFLSHQIGNEWIGIGGQVRAISQLVARLSMALLPGGEKPEAIISGGLFDNPLIQFYYFRGAPALSIISKVAEFATGADVAPFQKIDTLPDLMGSLWTSALPFTLQGHLQGDTALGSAASFFGARASPFMLREWWASDMQPYNDIPTDPRKLKQGQLTRTQYREQNPEVDAKLFITGQVSSLVSSDAITVAASLIRENRIDPQTIAGITGRIELLRRETAAGQGLKRNEVDALIELLAAGQQTPASQGGPAASPTTTPTTGTSPAQDRLQRILERMGATPAPEPAEVR